MGRGGSLSGAEVAVLGLAAFRLTRIVTTDDFPPVEKARTALLRKAGNSSLAEMIRCPWCSGWWVSAALGLAALRWPAVRRLAIVPALSAVAGLVSTLDGYLTAETPDMEPVEYVRVP